MQIFAKEISYDFVGRLAWVRQGGSESGVGQAVVAGQFGERRIALMNCGYDVGPMPALRDHH
ncbi:hypothetical protein J2S34_001253 [Nitrobacter winogradskyi]|uniref:Uncharacterized protein n=1 Tax=Nitrobacter winogradskyi TaxID=913 RepID=A0ACC6AGU6_NITWI|nr:hypothetical protein [Nitrobacter winogradskyi]MCP1998831.1 hypothetical protein [Nitrobacter winogradskyi]